MTPFLSLSCCTFVRLDNSRQKLTNQNSEMNLACLNLTVSVNVVEPKQNQNKALVRKRSKPTTDSEGKAKFFYLHESCQLAQTTVSCMVLSGVVKVCEEGQRNAQQAHHQIRDGQVKEKQLNRGFLTSPAQECYNRYHSSVTSHSDDEDKSFRTAIYFIKKTLVMLFGFNDVLVNKTKGSTIEQFSCPTIAVISQCITYQNNSFYYRFPPLIFGLSRCCDRADPALFCLVSASSPLLFGESIKA